MPLDRIRLLRAREAAEVLAISARKLWSMTNCGEIPSVRIGRAIRYSRADLVAWIEKQRAPRYRGAARPWTGSDHPDRTARQHRKAVNYLCSYKPLGSSP